MPRRSDGERSRGQPRLHGYDRGVMPLAVIKLNIDPTPQNTKQLSAILLLVGMLGAFLFIRTSARLMRSPKVPWWPGSVTSGELHIHHLVFGIIMLILAGFLEFALRPGEPWVEIFAVIFGIGAGLTLDEYALWLHLKDVYWAEDGRKSVDAVVIAALLGGLIVLGAVPVNKEDTSSLVAVVAALALVVLFAVLSALKGKYLFAVAGMIAPLISLIGAVRLAKPGSWWARRRYPEGGDKARRADERNERGRARYRRFQDLIGGTPST
jgi:uncharacterized protein involved in response to NO